MKSAQMRVVGRLVILSAVVFVVMSGAARAFAQSPAIEVRAAYAFLADEEFNLPVGWHADVGVGVGQGMSLIAEIGHSQTTMTVLRIPVTFTVTSYQFGSRFQVHRGSIQPFVQVLDGATRAGGATAVRGLSVNVSSTAFTLQPGGGVVVRVTRRLGVTGAADYRWGASDVGSLREVRLSGGVAWSLGR